MNPSAWALKSRVYALMLVWICAICACTPRRPTLAELDTDLSKCLEVYFGFSDLDLEDRDLRLFLKAQFRLYNAGDDLIPLVLPLWRRGKSHELDLARFLARTGYIDRLLVELLALQSSEVKSDRVFAARALAYVVEHDEGRLSTEQCAEVVRVCYEQMLIATDAEAGMFLGSLSAFTGLRAKSDPTLGLDERQAQREAFWESWIRSSPYSSHVFGD